MDLSGNTSRIFKILKGLDSLDSLKDLFWSGLNYDRIDKRISRKSWGHISSDSLAEDPILWATAGDGNAFHIIYSRLDSDRLLLGPQRAVIESLLKEHPYTLFVFSNKVQTDWHFVNVRMTKKTIDDEETTKSRATRRMFRRISVGVEDRAGNRLRTASERLSKIDIEQIQTTNQTPTPLEIQKAHDTAFDVEKVTELFYDEYKKVFDHLQNDLVSQTADKKWAHDYSLQFLNRCTFIYFVQRKLWLNEDPNFLYSFWKTYLKAKQPQDTFWEKWLNILFFEAFNEKFHGGHRHFPDNIKAALQTAPFLNGGLFAENDLDNKYDGQFSITDSRFEKVIGFLDRFNFTISEDTPLDQEVAVNAEMLGRVYESLVNVSEETDEKGDAGIFYTPRTEIDLMCRLTLVDHLSNHLGDKLKPILYEAVFAYSDEEKGEADRQLSGQNLWPKLEELLNRVTVVDPACGSGSFLIGMLQILDDLIKRGNIVTGREETPYERKKRIIGQSLYGVDVMRWAVDVAELRLWLQLVIETELESAELKFRPLLPNLSFKIRCGDSLVQEIGGINMAHMRSSHMISPAIKGKLTKLKGDKLKFYNSVTHTRQGSENRIKIDELSLFKEILGVVVGDLRSKVRSRKNILSSSSDFWGEESGQISESNRRKAEEEISVFELELEQANHGLKALSKGSSEVPFVWDLAFVEVFEGDRQGFDIVIGNPPYVRQESISDPKLDRKAVTKENKRVYKSKLINSVYAKYPYFFGNNPTKPKHKIDAKSDLYIYFFFHCLSLLHDKGSFSFITSNSWLDVGYGRDLQEFLLINGRVKMVIDNKIRRSFKNASVNSTITLLGSLTEKKNLYAKESIRFVMFTEPFENVLSPVIFQEIESITDRQVKPEFNIHAISQHNLYVEGCAIETDSGATSKSHSRRGPLLRVERYIGNKWGGKYLRAPDIYWTILEKSKGRLVRLGDIADVRFGIKTGANDFFYIPNDYAELVINKSTTVVLPKNGEFEPFKIEEEMARHALFSLKDIDSIERIREKNKKLLIVLPPVEKHRLPREIRNYINFGESKGYHQRPSCTTRKHWYSVGYDWKPAPFIFPSKIGERFLVYVNHLRLLEDKKLYGITPHKSIASSEQWAVVLNSSLLRLFMEITSRQLTGAQAIADVDVTVVKNLQIPNPELLNKSACHAAIESFDQRVESCFKEFGIDKSIPVHNQIPSIIAPRLVLDKLVFSLLGLNSLEQTEIYLAIADIVKARLDKADSV